MIVAPVLLLLAFGRWLLKGEPVGRGWRSAAFLLVLYGAICAGSFLYAANLELTREALMNYVDGVFIVLVLVLYLRDGNDLRRAAAALVLGSILLGTLTVFQQLTGSYDQTYAGLARATLRNLHDNTGGFRSEGPVSANYFALVLLISVPLAVDWLVREQRWMVRAAAVYAVVGVIAAIVYTYSRGGLVALAATAIPMAAWIPKSQRKRWAIAGAVAAIAAVAVVAPTNYGQRLAALAQVGDVVRGETPSESALRGRLSEVKSAALMFVSHPVVGVGYGNFEHYYHQYSRDLALDARRETRQAHSLYLQVAAETGIVGVVGFAALLVYAIAGVLRARANLQHRGLIRDAQRVGAFGIALFGYLVGSVFLHLSYPRYFWLLIGIALGIAALADDSPEPEPLEVAA